jgi:hypothetical protein
MYGRSFKSFEECYETITSGEVEGFQVADFEEFASTDIVAYFEEKLKCSGLCFKPPLFYFS